MHVTEALAFGSQFEATVLKQADAIGEAATKARM